MLHVSPATRILNENPDIESNILARAIFNLSLNLLLCFILVISYWIYVKKKKGIDKFKPWHSTRGNKN